MHPFLGKSRSLFAIAMLWLVLAGFIAALIAQTKATPLVDTALVFIPWYFLLLFFCLSNFYMCSWLPLAQTPPLRLVVVQLMALACSIALWLLLGQWWSTLLQSADITQTINVFAQTRSTNAMVGAALYLVWLLLHYAYIQATATEQDNSRALAQQLLISQVELQTLKASTHPHFMYNSLNLLANLALVEPEKIHAICIQMADFLRYSVNYAKRERVTLGDEIDHISNYLAIEHERFGKRLQVELQLDNELRELPVIPLLLFPLIENSIKHGISTTTEAGYIRLHIQRRDQQLLIQVQNSCDPEGRAAPSTGLGLASLKKRIAASYGSTASWQIHADAEQFRVDLQLPIAAKLLEQAS